ncbi:MAG: BON domain-containing protein [Phycisphaeraceae bacterium]|nr:BON domain-containing protein [Phycisphaeraceae bacterium]
MATMTAAKSDTQIKTDVLNELKWDTRVDETEVGVQVKGGVVTLTGHVPSYGKKIAAVEAAHRVHGVLDVVNELDVRLPMSWRKTDQDVAQAVRHALQWDVLVPDEHISTTVSNGVVTLKGDVETWTQRADAESAIRRLGGVKGVTNLISVKPRSADPAAIKRQIEQALERQAEREAGRIGVSVVDGVVTLTGKVRSWSERRAVEGAASFGNGVRRVDDHTTVDPYG